MLGDGNSYVKAVDECIPCILKKATTILERSKVQDSEKIVQEIESQLISLSFDDSWLLSRSTTGLCPAQFGSIRQHVLEKYGYGNTYQKEKQFGQKIGKKFFEQISDENISWLNSLIYSLIGNGMEFDPQGEYKEIKLENLLEDPEKIYRNFTKMRQLTAIATKLENKKPGNLVFIFDNAGEEYFDLPLLKKFEKKGWNLNGIIKGDAVLNDLSVDDVIDIPVKIAMYNTGSSNVGIFLSKIPQEVRNMIESADLVISKGMANFETLSSEALKSDCLFLLKAKCEPVAQVTGTELDNYIGKLQEKGKPWL